MRSFCFSDGDGNGLEVGHIRTTKIHGFKAFIISLELGAFINTPTLYLSGFGKKMKKMR